MAAHYIPAGDRNAVVVGPIGNTGCIATHQETLSPDELTELAKRARENMR